MPSAMGNGSYGLSNQNLEDHPSGCKWLITMVSFRPIRIGQRGTPSKWPNFMTYKPGVALTTCKSWDEPTRSGFGLN